MGATGVQIIQGLLRQVAEFLLNDSVIFITIQRFAQDLFI